MGTASLLLNPETKVLDTFNFGPVTELDFSSSGGTEDPNLVFAGSGTQFAFDNLTVNAAPEPTAASICGIGFGTLVLLQRRRAGQHRERS